MMTTISNELIEQVRSRIDIPENEWRLQELKALEILIDPEKTVYIHKQGTRVGATFSILGVAKMLELKIVVFEPYHKIHTHAVYPAIQSVDENYTTIYLNAGHLKSMDIMCSKCRTIGNISFKGNCNKCKKFDNDCRLQTFLNTDFPVTMMSYSKVLLANQYDSEVNQIINQKIQDADLIFMDEYSHAIHVDPYEINVKELLSVFHKIVENNNENDDINDVKLLRYLDEFHDIIGNVYDEDINDFYFVSIFKDDFKSVMRFLSLMDKRPYLTKNDKICLQGFIFSMSYDHFYIMDGMIIPDVTHPVETYNKMIKESKGIVRITDALLPTTRMLPGKTIEWPDFKNNQSRQLIIADSRKAPLAMYKTDLKKYGRDYNEQMDRLRKYMYYTLMMHGMDNVFTFSVNKSVTRDVRNFKIDGLEELDNGLDFNNIKIQEYERMDHFRADSTAGTPIPERIVVCINLPFTKGTSFKNEGKLYANLSEYDHLFKTIKKYQNGKISQEQKELLIHNQIRWDEIMNQFFNAIGRPKDPNGIFNTVIPVFGNTKDEIKSCLPPGDWNIVSVMRNEFLLESFIMTQIWLSAGEPSDVPILSDMTRLIRYMVRHPTRYYKYSDVSRGAHVKKIEKLIRDHKHLVPNIIQHKGFFEVDPNGLEFLKLLNYNDVLLTKSIQSTIDIMTKKE